MIRSLTVLASAVRGWGEPCERVRIAGTEALVARPRRGFGPVVVFANAATPRGIEEPAVGCLVGSLARAGFTAVAPELPCTKRGEVTPATIEALVDVTAASGGRVALVGASTGAGLVLLAAADPRLADRVTAVAAVAPFACLRNVLRLGTTGYYGDRPFEVAPIVATAAARSLSASAPDDPAVAALLRNSDPDRFDALYGDLLPSTRALVENLSPVTFIQHIRAPVELASAPDDVFFPLGESRTLERAGHDVRLTVTSALNHVSPRLRPGLLGVLGLLDRTLRRAAAAEQVSWELRPSLA